MIKFVIHLQIPKYKFNKKNVKSINLIIMYNNNEKWRNTRNLISKVCKIMIHYKKKYLVEL